MQYEYEPQPRLEEEVLVRLGYEHCLDTPLEAGGPIVGRNFLDVYQNAPKRQDTEDLLQGFIEMSKADPDYAATKAYITRFIETFFGPPRIS